MHQLDYHFSPWKHRKHYHAFIILKIIFSPTSMNSFQLVWWVYKLKYYNKVTYVSNMSFFLNNISCWIYYNNVKDPSKEVAQRCSVKKVFLKFCTIYRKTPMSESFFIKVSNISLTLTQVFSSEFCDVYKSTFFIKDLRCMLLRSLSWFALVLDLPSCSLLDFFCWKSLLLEESIKHYSKRVFCINRVINL